MWKRSVHEKWSKEAAHAIVASDWLQQQQDYYLLAQTLWPGNVNISPMAIRAIFKPYSKHGLTPQNANDDNHRKIRLKAKGELLKIAQSPQFLITGSVELSLEKPYQPALRKSHAQDSPA
jgi:hypothetical protein